MNLIPYFWHEIHTYGPYLALTLGSYFLLHYLQRFVPGIRPGISAIVLVSLVLHLLEIPYEDYLRGVSPLLFFLGPATISLAAPLFRERRLLKKLLFPLLLTLILSSFIAICSVVGIGYLLGLPQSLLRPLALKSVSSPFALVISQTAHINQELSVLFVIITGIMVGLIGRPSLKLMKIKNPTHQGLAIGLAGHGLGVASVMGKGNEIASFAVLAMALNGPITAILISYLSSFL